MVFIDIDIQIIDELNRQKSHYVIIKSEKDELLIRNVRGVLSTDEREVIDEIATASMQLEMNFMIYYLPWSAGSTSNQKMKRGMDSPLMRSFL